MEELKAATKAVQRLAQVVARNNELALRSFLEVQVHPLPLPVVNVAGFFRDSHKAANLRTLLDRVPSARLVGENCRAGVVVVDAMGYLYLTARSGNTYADLASIVARRLVAVAVKANAELLIVLADNERPVEKLFTSFTRRVAASRADEMEDDIGAFVVNEDEEPRSGWLANDTARTAFWQIVVARVAAEAQERRVDVLVHGNLADKQLLFNGVEGAETTLGIPSLATEAELRAVQMLASPLVQGRSRRVLLRSDDTDTVYALLLAWDKVDGAFDDICVSQRDGGWFSARTFVDAMKELAPSGTVIDIVIAGKMLGDDYCAGLYGIRMPTVIKTLLLHVRTIRYAKKEARILTHVEFPSDLCFKMSPTG